MGRLSRFGLAHSMRMDWLTDSIQIGTFDADWMADRSNSGSLASRLRPANWHFRCSLTDWPERPDCLVTARLSRTFYFSPLLPPLNHHFSSTPRVGSICEVTGMPEGWSCDKGDSHEHVHSVRELLMICTLTRNAHAVGETPTKSAPMRGTPIEDILERIKVYQNADWEDMISREGRTQRHIRHKACLLSVCVCEWYVSQMAFLRTNDKLVPPRHAHEKYAGENAYHVRCAAMRDTSTRDVALIPVEVYLQESHPVRYTSMRYAAGKDKPMRDASVGDRPM
jgi:hypothetical protein